MKFKPWPKRWSSAVKCFLMRFMHGEHKALFSRMKVICTPTI